MNENNESSGVDKPSYKLNSFEGPLDLLLYLIKKNEVNIYDIPIAQITGQYIEMIKLASGVDLEVSSDFYLMASTLLYIKSRMLLPVEVDFDEDMEDPRRELVERLIEYQKYKKLSSLMEQQGQEKQWIVEREKQPHLPFPDEDQLLRKMDIWELVQSFSRIMESIQNERIVNLYEEVSVNEKITLMSELLETQDELYFQDLLINPQSFLEVVCAFLAMLEQVKNGLVEIFQNRLFGDIIIRRKEE
ncbi:MAG: segregation/condensation protein A [Spirochaetaceae bacterium]|jgi:segregation and condensation protein A|nr:segregation/condensation protein A [Spirochaetaceae bacterium]